MKIKLKMIFNKIACNTNNSFAIDEEGDIQVWGSGRNGLLGKPKQQHPFFTPLRADLNHEHSAITIDIACGEYHGVAVQNDKFTNKELIRLEFAKELLDEIYHKIKFNIRKMNEKNKKIDSMEVVPGKKRKRKAIVPKDVGEYIMDYFKNRDFLISKEGEETSLTYKVHFLKFLSQDVNISYKEKTILGQILVALQDRHYFPEKNDIINIKEFRDQILGYRYDNGKVYTWGVYNDGRLGRNLGPDDKEPQDSEILSLSPGIVEFPPKEVIVKVSCGNSHTLALTLDGEVYAWGNGQKGCLGLGDMKPYYTPQKIKYTSSKMEFNDIKDIACGGFHSLALNGQGKIFSWGNGIGGRLGHGDEKGQNTPTFIQKSHLLAPIMISAGACHSALITFTNELYTWGEGSYGRLGNGLETSEYTPKHVEELKQKKITFVSCGTFHTLCTTFYGKVYAFGGGKYGKLGIDAGVETNFSTPKQLLTLDEIKIVQVAAGNFHSLGLSDEGKLFTWGSFHEGKLGHAGLTKNLLVPTPIEKITFSVPEQTIESEDNPLFDEYDDTFKIKKANVNVTKSTEVIQISCGLHNTAFLTNGGELFVCGSGNKGQLGKKFEEEDRKEEDKSSESNSDDEDNNHTLENPIEFNFEEYDPYLIPKFSGNSSVRLKYVSCGTNHIIAICRLGEAYAWGSNSEGQLGIGVIPGVPIFKPKKIKALMAYKCKMSACGENHSLILTDNGDVHSFGMNDYGKLGIQTISIQENIEEEPTKTPEGNDNEENELKVELQPRKIAGLTDVKFIACSKNHSLALADSEKKAGAFDVFTWGSGWNGKLGHGNYENQYRPKKINLPEEVSFVMAGCGHSHTVFLDSEGSVWFCGSKYSVGRSVFNSDSKTVPEKLRKQDDYDEYKFLSVGDSHNFVIDRIGRVFGFGKNNFHKINGAKPDNYIYMEALDSDEPFSFIACGSNHSSAINKKGIPYSWGNLGNGRCGLKLDILNDYQKNSYMSSSPKEIEYLKNILAEEKRKIEKIQGEQKEAEGKKANEDEDEPLNTEENEKKDVPIDYIKWPIQKKLQNEKVALKEINLINRDCTIFKQYCLLIKGFSGNISNLSKNIFAKKYKAQNSIISRIYTFPLKIPILQDILTKLPKVVSQNKQLYEILFSSLQTHPCYLMNIFKLKKFSNPNDFVNMIKSIFGFYELHNNNRKIHILLCLAKMIFKKELETMDINECFSSIGDSVFHRIFHLIFKSQSSNINYLEDLILRVVKRFKKIGVKDEEKQMSLFNYEQMSFDEYKEKNSIIIEALEYIAFKIKKSFDPTRKRKQLQKGRMITNEIIGLAMIAKSLIKKKLKANIKPNLDKFHEPQDNQKDQNQQIPQIKVQFNALVLYLIFEPFCKKLMNLKHITQYVDETTLKDYPIFGVPKHSNDFSLTNKNNFYSIGSLFMRYLKSEKLSFSNEMVKDLNNCLFVTSRRINNDLVSRIKMKEIDLTITRIQDELEHSSELTTNNLTVKIDSLLDIHNIVVTKKEEIVNPNFEDDPINIVVTELGEKPISKKNIDAEVRELFINLELKTKLLENSDILIKCEKCESVLNDFYFPERVVLKTVQEKDWVCECGTQNFEVFLRCKKCGRFRQNLSPNIPFIRYEPEYKFDLLECFEKVLFEMPLIPGDVNFMEFIQSQRNMYKEKNDTGSYHKTEIIDQFLIKFLPGYDEMSMPATLEKLNLLVHQLEFNYWKRVKHSKYLESVEHLLDFINHQERKLQPNESDYSNHIEEMIKRVYNSEGNHFRVKQEELISGNLAKKQRIVSPSLTKFIQAYRNIAAAESVDSDDENPPHVFTPTILFQNLSSYGVFHTKYLFEKSIVQGIKLHNKKCKKIIKKCYYHFLDDGDGGFYVRLVFKDRVRSMRQCSASEIESTIQDFQITKEQFSEMRRTKSTKNTTFFGTAEFNIFQFVHFLNIIKSRTYRFLQY